MGFFERLKGVFLPKKSPVLGLALGSGGAKGMAHLGVLKALEEHGISFRVVTGTSIGSIVGALYAKGFSSLDMTEIVRGFSLREFGKNIRPFADPAFIETLLRPYLEGNIEDMPLPFAAWATDAHTNEGVLLDRGNVARALSASAAIPPFFRSVEWEGRQLYDGAYTNAIPADVCKDLGADVVIGCDLSAYTPTETEQGNLMRVIGTALSAFVPVTYRADSKTRGYEACEVMLRPNLSKYRATDVSRMALDEMYEIGYEEARSRMDEILAVLKKAGVQIPRKK